MAKNLFVQVTETGGKSWLLIYILTGRRRWIGLGPRRYVSVEQALQKRREARDLIDRRIDPLDVKAKQAAVKDALTFGEASR